MRFERCRSDASAHTALCVKLSQLGRFDSAKPGPSVGGAPTVEVLYEPQYGTGFKQQSVSLLRVVRGEWRPIWTHLSEDSSIDPFIDAEDHKRFHWRYEAGGNRVRVTGSHASLSKEHARREAALAVETYCYRPASQRFVRCP
jgi:phage-related protein